MYIITMIGAYFGKYKPIYLDPEKKDIEVLRTDYANVATKFHSKSSAQSKIKELKKDSEVQRLNYKFRIKKLKGGSSYTFGYNDTSKQFDVKAFKKKIESTKKKLINKAKKKGLYENFGQKEVRMIKDSVNIYDLSYDDRNKVVNLISSFDDFVQNYEG